MSTRIENALIALTGDGQPPVAPHVAARLARFAAGDPATLRQLAAGLTAEQLAGSAMLGDPLPSTPALLEAVRPRLDGLHAAGRRLLLTAALSASDRADVLLAAAATEIDVLLDGVVPTVLAVDDGRFAFRDEGVRAVVAHTAAPYERAEIHAALARALRASGAPELAAWHALLGGAHGPTSTQLRTLLGLAEERLRSGHPTAAYSVASELAERASGELRTRAEGVAGQAAFACGCLADAERWLARARRGGAAGQRAAAEAALDAIARLREGPAESPDPLLRMAEHVDVLSTAAVTASDHTAMAGVAAVAETWWTDPVEADAIQARLFLSAVRSVPPWPWTTPPGPLSPLIEAYVRGQHAGLQLHAGDLEGAVRTLRDALDRLPMTHIGGGVTASALKLLGSAYPDAGPAIRAAFAAIAPRRVVVYETLAPLVGAKSSAVAARRSERDQQAVRDAFVAAEQRLSPREREVVALVLDGLGNRAIAERLQISDRTVEVHLGSVFRKTGVRTRTELLARALR